MDSFISTLAASLYERYGDGISSLKMLFPSRRARLFFCDALSRVTLRPVWQPQFLSVDDLMEDIAGIKKGDHIKLVTELYKIYSRYHTESFDAFYFWGDMLLGDFDSIDKYMINADVLFANISDLRTLETDFSYLTPEQLSIIRQFWRNFGLESDYSEEKEHFITIWRTLAKIYHEFRESLLAQNLAYTGMVHRMAADKIKDGSAKLSDKPEDRYVVVGFNALSECEKTLFGWLQKGGKSEFYWDYDNYYVDNIEQEAGYFMRNNIRNFPSPDRYVISHDNFVNSKEIVAVDAPSDSLQCKYVHTFLQTLIERGEMPGKDTAIVLTDENLLLPVLYSIPDTIESVNVTMGYPLRQTTAYSFVERLLELQNRARIKNGVPMFYHSDVEGILNHPYLMEIDADVATDILNHIKKFSQVYVKRDMFNVDGVIGDIFVITEDWQALSCYIKNILSDIGRQTALENDYIRRREFFTVIIDNICQVENSLQDCGIEVTSYIFASLLRKVLQNVRIPYEGEPLEGVQVMGILETRNLDFRNVLILSVNDDTFPGNRTVSSSFIPYNLRIAYGLPTPREHESVYGYYFYRLLQRAERIHLVYCSGSDDKRTGEPSRYIYQLMYESPHEVNRVSIPLNVNLSQSNSISIEKEGDVLEKLLQYRGKNARILSPTSFYTYIECPLKFYFCNIENIRPEDEIEEDIDLPMFGTILHKAMELLYSGLVDVFDPRSKIKSLIGSKAVDKAVTDAINGEYLHDADASQDEYGGNVLLVKDIVRKYINGSILPYDASRQEPFVIKYLEKHVECHFEDVTLGGMADRIDLLNNGALRVVDYKTGSRKADFESVELLFSDDREKRSSAVLQTLLYSMMLYSVEKCDVIPELYYVREMNRPDFSPLLSDKLLGPVTSFLPYLQSLEENIDKTLQTLFNISNPFRQCSDRQVCQYCDYREICRR